MKWSDEAVEAAARSLIDTDSVFNGFHEMHMEIFRPRARAALEAASAVAEKEHGDLRAEVERLTRELEEVKSYGIAASRLSEKVRDDGYKRAAEAESRAKSAEAERDELRKVNAELSVVFKELNAATSALAEMRKALEFYAERMTYVARSGMDCAITRDHFGDKARNALRSLAHKDEHE